MTFTALFFNDDIIRALYIYKGNANKAVHIQNIISSSICSFIANFIIRNVSLSNINKVLTVKRTRKCAIIKLYFFYSLSGLIILLCWYYVTAFCAVFKNSQKYFLINFALCFIVCNICPLITSFILTIMRRVAIDKNHANLYKASQIMFIF